MSKKDLQNEPLSDLQWPVAGLHLAQDAVA